MLLAIRLHFLSTMPTKKTIATASKERPPVTATLIARLSQTVLLSPCEKPLVWHKSQRFQGLWSEMGDSNSRPDGPKPMSEPSGSPVAPSLALSGTPSVPLWNSFALFVSGTTFVFWDLCGIEFCILKVLPTRFTSDSGCFCRREQLRNCAA